MKKEYIILNSEKRATHPFKDGVGAKTWDEVKDFDNIAQIVPEPFIVLDFDTKSDSEIIQKIVNGENLKCRMMKTTKGVHVWFKSLEPWKCFIKTRLAIGIYSDCKSHSKNAYVKIKDSGKSRVWLKETPLEDIQDIPRYLYPVLQPGEQFKFKGMADGSGRNQELFNYIVYLQSKGFTKEEIKETIRIINTYVFAEPLSDYEIQTLTRDDAFKPEDEIEKQIQKAEKKAGWSHNEFGDELINKLNIITINNQFFIYDSGIYKPDINKTIEKKMVDLYPAIKQRQRAEVLSYIRIKTEHSKTIKVNPYIVNLKNTRLDIRTDECLPFSSNLIEFNKIPVNYDPGAYSYAVDNLLNKIFCNDSEIRRLFEEMIGYILLKKCNYAKAFIFYGNGSNGKSTLLNILKKFVGPENCSTIELDKLTHRFQGAELENKLLNIGDDINQKPISDTGTLKKIFAGETITVERKGETPFSLTPYAKHIFACNEIPKNKDMSEGMYRRWIFIPFNAKFSSKDPDFDPFIVEKISTDEALSYLLNLGLKGIKTLLKEKKFINPAVVERTMTNYKIENSSFLSWIDDQSIEEDYILNHWREDIRTSYMIWCSQNKMEPLGTRIFNGEIEKHFNVTAYRSSNKSRRDYKFKKTQ